MTSDTIPPGSLALVTGGAGFIGSHLVDALLGQNARVRVLDDLSSGRVANLGGVLDRIEFLEGDVRDLETCRKAASGADLVFHQAARGSVPRSMADPAGTIAVNVIGTANIFAAARDARVRRVIYASSSSVYGDSCILPKREGEEGAVLSPYALSKRMNEESADVFVRAFGMELVGLRYFNVFGPRQDPDGPYAAVVPRFFKACLVGEAPVIYGDGEQSRDFTFVSDVVNANILAAVAGREAVGKACNVAAGRGVTVRRLADSVRFAAGKGKEPDYQPDRLGDVRHSLADLTRAAGLLGFEPRVSLPDGLAATARWYLTVVSQCQ